MVPLIPRDVLFGNPERMSPRISPDGRCLAWIAPDEGVLNVWVSQLGESERARVVTHDRDRGIRTFLWAHDNRHLLYLQDQAGDENWRLYAVALENGAERDLTPFDDVQTRVMRADKRFPNRILVGINRDDPHNHDVYRLELAQGRLTKIVDNPGFASFVADSQLEVRAAVEATPDGGVAIHVRDGATDDWRPLLVAGPDDSLTTDPLAFSLDGRTLLLRSSVGARTARLVRLDGSTGAEQVIAEDPDYDISNVGLDPDTYEPRFVVVLKERAEITVLDPAIADDVAAIQALARGDLTLHAGDDADRLWLAEFETDDASPGWYAFDRETGAATFLFEQQPALSGYTLARMEPFSFTARDGLAIHGYLTFPPGMPRERLPAVLNVHGGPWARNAWGFHPEAQWLANRGYLCIQVNYRGSTGYGKDFVNAGDREWGGKMHDDLIDAVRHVAERGYVDPDRIAIYGGSYGGYAALVGATFTPDVFRCAVAVVAPSNLKTLIASIPPYWRPIAALFHRRIGNPEADADFMWSRSPLSRVDQIRIPMLIVQGKNDPRVPEAEAEQIVAAMRKRGIDHEYLLFEDEGHGMAKPENRLAFYAAAERFLARHLGGRFEPPTG